jgi:hypothetical protein
MKALWLICPQHTHISAVREKKWSLSSEISVMSHAGSASRTAIAASIPATPFPMITMRMSAHDTTSKGPSYSLVET